MKTKLRRKETSKQFSFLINWKFVNKRHQSEQHFFPFKNAWKQAYHSCVYVQYIKISSKEYTKMMSIFCPLKLRRMKHVKIRSTFCQPKLCRIKYVERNVDFLLIEIISKNTSKRRGNLSIFSFRRFDVISMSNLRQLNMFFPLDFNVTVIVNIKLLFLFASNEREHVIFEVRWLSRNKCYCEEFESLLAYNFCSFFRILLDMSCKKSVLRWRNLGD